MKLPDKIIFIAFIFYSSILTAQKLPFDNYNIYSGLPSNFVWDVQQDNKGYLWFATQSGVSRFDGYNFQNIGIDKGLISNDVHCIFADTKGNMWFGSHGGGLSEYNNYNFVNYTREDGLCNNDIDFIFEDSEEGIWAASKQGESNGVSRIYKGRVYNLTKSDGLKDDQVVCFYIDKNNRVWLGTGRGYAIFSVAGSKVKIEESGLEEQIIWSITEDFDGNVWIGTQGGGLFKKTTDSERFVPVPNPYSDIILCILSDRSHNLWFGTFGSGAFRLNSNTNKFEHIGETGNQTIWILLQDKSNRIWMVTFYNDGVYVLEDQTLRHITTKSNLIDNLIKSIDSDSEGNVWIATISGVSKIGKKPFEIYTEDFGLPQKEILSVLADRKDKIWIGTYLGLAQLSTDNNEIRNYDTKNPFSPDVFSIYEDRESNIWLGTYDGLTRFSDGQFKLIRDKIWGPKNNNFALDFIEDKSHNLWIAHSLGLCRYANNQCKNFTTEDGLPDNQTKALTIDKKGKIWIATSNGVAIYNNGKFEVINESDGLSNNTCNDICTDDDNHIWVATENGLNKITRDDTITNITRFTTRNGLASNSILFVVADHIGNLWIGHGNGLNKMNLTSYKTTYFGRTEGFTPLETYGRSVSVDCTNNVWIGTGDGLVKYIHRYDTLSDIKPKTYITGIKLFNDSTDISVFSSGIDSITGLPESLILPYNKSNLVFEYVALHYALPEKNLYKYMLKGYDDKWSEITTKTSTDPYRKIPHGTYTFMLLAANSDAMWIDEPVTFSFVIKPPFWKTPLAYIAELFLGVTILYLVVRLRVRKLQQDKKILAQKVKERTIEIEKQRDHIALQNKEITSSIMYAKRIQSAVLPADDLVSKLLKQHFILFKPRDIVSGDFYWITEKDDKVILVAADCTGHGVPGAFMSMLGVSLLNEIVNNVNKVSACEILNQLRSNVKKTLSQKGRQDETKDGMDLVLCIFDFGRMSLEFAGAYNPLWLIRDGELIVYKGDKMPIGIYVGTEKPFTCQDITIKKDDLIYMFSDGYADQFGGPDEKKFKSGTLKELLVNIHNKPLSEQKNILDNTIINWQGELQQIDDIMVVGVKV